MRLKALSYHLVVILVLGAIGSVDAKPRSGVVFETSAGTIVLELYPQAAPLSVTNFLKYVEGGFYRGASFYRVVRSGNQAQNPVKIAVIQGGLGFDAGPLPYPPIAHESTRDSGIRHLAGTLSMARLEPGTAGSEFFICVTDQPELDFGGRRNPDGLGFAAFGKVVEGMEVIRRIQQMKTLAPAGKLEYTSGQILAKPVVIKSAKKVFLPEPPENNR